MKLDDGNGKQPKTPGERAWWWTKSIVALTTAGLAIYAARTGSNAEEGVDKSYETLAEQVNKQNKVINAQSEKLEKLTRRMVFFQAHQAGYSAGKLYERNEMLQKQLDELRAKKLPRSVSRDQIVEILRGSRVEDRKLKPPKATKPPALPAPPSREQMQKLHPLPKKPAWGK